MAETGDNRLKTAEKWLSHRHQRLYFSEAISADASTLMSVTEMSRGEVIRN